MNHQDTIRFPVVLGREGAWFVASCPPLGIATQGKSEQEVKESMADLIEEYYEDPETPKPPVEEIESATLSVITLPVKIVRAHGKTQTAAPG